MEYLIVFSPLALAGILLGHSFTKDQCLDTIILLDFGQLFHKQLLLYLHLCNFHLNLIYLPILIRSFRVFQLLYISLKLKVLIDPLLFLCYELFDLLLE